MHNPFLNVENLKKIYSENSRLEMTNVSALPEEEKKKSLSSAEVST